MENETKYNVWRLDTTIDFCPEEAAKKLDIVYKKQIENAIKISRETFWGQLINFDIQAENIDKKEIENER